MYKQEGVLIKVYIFNNGKTIRITIPKRIWEALGSPTSFRLTIENSKIVLTPVK